MNYTQISYYRDTQTAQPLLCCAECGGELFDREVYYEIGGRPICRDCLYVFSRRYFRHCRRQVLRRDVR